MNKSNHDTAILIFSRPSVEEVKKKTLVPQNKTRNLQSIQWLRNRTIELAQTTGLPCFITEHQKGSTFGDRLANAFQDVFDRGYRHVIAIGNDCTELTEVDLKKAARLVAQGKSVLGPDQRNGAYLIGLSQNQFDADLMALLPWKTENTFQSLVDYLGVTDVLEVKKDLNNKLDFKDLIRNGSRSIRRTIYTFLDTILTCADFEFEAPASILCLQPSHRGPPQ